MSCLHPSPLPGSWHRMNYLWQEETRCNNQRGNLEDSRGLLLFRGRCPYPLHVNHNTGPVHADVLKPVLANFNPWPRKLISPGDPGMVDRLEGARISLSVCKEQKRMGGDHPPLLGCLCLKLSGMKALHIELTPANPCPCCPHGQPSREQNTGGSRAASAALSTAGLSPALPHCRVHPFSRRLQTPSPPCSCNATAVTPWQTQPSYCEWLVSPRMLNPGLKSQTLAEEELLWKGAGLGCQGTPCCSSSQPPFHSPKLGALLRAPLLLHAGAVAAFPASRLQPYL